MRKPAFPVAAVTYDGRTADTPAEREEGLTQEQWFLGKALQGLCASGMLELLNNTPAQMHNEIFDRTISYAHALARRAASLPENQMIQDLGSSPAAKATKKKLGRGE